MSGSKQNEIKQNAKPQTLGADVVWVAEAGDVGVQRFETVLSVLGAHVHGLGDLLVHDDVDFDALFGLALQQAVEPPFGVICRRTAQVQLGGEPPIL